MRLEADSEQNGMENNLLRGARNFTTRRLAKMQNGNLGGQSTSRCCYSICEQFKRHVRSPLKRAMLTIRCPDACKDIDVKGCDLMCSQLDPNGEIFAHEECKYKCEGTLKYCVDKSEVGMGFLEGIINVFTHIA